MTASGRVEIQLKIPDVVKNMTTFIYVDAIKENRFKNIPNDKENRYENYKF